MPERPDLRVALEGTPVDVAEFSDWIAGRLPEVILSLRGPKLRAQPAALAKWLRLAAEDVPAAIHDGRLRTPPAYAVPHIWHAAHAAGYDWDQLVKKRDAATMARCLRTAAEAAAKPKSLLGRPKRAAADTLLRDVVQRLRGADLGSDDAHARAVLIMRACRVPVPGEDSIRRAALRAKG